EQAWIAEALMGTNNGGSAREATGAWEVFLSPKGEKNIGDKEQAWIAGALMGTNKGSSAMGTAGGVGRFFLPEGGEKYRGIKSRHGSQKRLWEQTTAAPRWEPP
ncbi:MAG: hypothetical protein Q4F18_12045, partial [Clostridia bacterium]|nr:hypothetical protein [Clostridia bacterium]